MTRSKRLYKGTCIGGPLAGHYLTSQHHVHVVHDIKLRPAKDNKNAVEFAPGTKITKYSHTCITIRAEELLEVHLWVVDGMNLQTALQEMLLAYVGKQRRLSEEIDPGTGLKRRQAQKQIIDSLLKGDPDVAKD